MNSKIVIWINVSQSQNEVGENKLYESSVYYIVYSIDNF